MSLKSKIMYTKAVPSHLKKPFSHFLIAACILIGGYSAAGAEDSVPKIQGKLAFANIEKEVVLEVGETNKATAFEFTNQGEKPIRIVGIKSSCGCTVIADKPRVETINGLNVVAGSEQSLHKLTLMA
jgi:hypothetical protein